MPVPNLLAAFALAVVVFVSPKVDAAAPFQHLQAPGFFRMMLGDFEITTLYDGDVNLDMHLMQANEQLLAPLLKADFSDTKFYKGYVCGFLINTGSRLILVDAGSGGHWGPPTLGKLLANLKASGYQPEQVDTVLITHLHPDHVPGIELPDGNRAFPNAKIRMARAESDFWLSKSTQTKAPPEAQEFFDIAQKAAAPYIKAGQWLPFDGDTELLPGIMPIPIAGHTPGHTGYEVSSKGQVLLIWGDVVHAEPVQIPHPEITIAFDADSESARISRQDLFQSLSSSGKLIAGPHMPFPAIGHIRKDADGYVWVPIPYIGSLPD
ncbi:MBL fold metallo-hydrolase [Rhodoferax koreense]|uniref:MBL fold metallo-hydrolase n=1 Tax=Rhodoferax koreensis TaxID=1842727 RepID=A0A1P8K4D4_9BURK|nr:MBL fold metallo-hydrolase [Rhodoferax koreense]